jgi:hypothetical protein
MKPDGHAGCFRLCQHSFNQGPAKAFPLAIRHQLNLAEVPRFAVSTHFQQANVVAGQTDDLSAVEAVQHASTLF